MKLEQSFARMDRQISRLWRTMDTPAEANALSFNEYDYLKTIQILKQPRLSEIAKDLAVQKPSASNMVMRLEKKGLVKRSPCLEDGRATRISLTEKSQALLQHDDVLYSSLAEQIRSKLDEQDGKELERLLALATK